MTEWDKNKRIYECLREIYILTHNRDESELLGGTPQNVGLDFDPLGINTLEKFNEYPELYGGKDFGPEEVILP